MAKWMTSVFVYLFISLPKGSECTNNLYFEEHIDKQEKVYSGKKSQPNIIFILADDMGWNDVGWNNKDIYSPNMVKLASEGIQLNNSYFLQSCSPSRASLMTGYYAFRTGFQDQILTTLQAKGLPLKFTTLANRLKDLGYATHLIGKWHLGNCHEAYTPTNRGFDSFFGHFQSSHHYYTHLSFVYAENHERCGYDFWNGTKPEWQYMGIHSSIPYLKQAKLVLESHDRSKPLFLYFAMSYPHIPHEVPEEFENLYENSSVKNVFRRKFMARVSALDHDIGQFLTLLKENGLYENSVIVFSSDNGANHYSAGSNYPFRGGKKTFYEGGTKVPGFIHSPLLPKKSFTYNGLIHVVDWVPTLVAVAGGSTADTDLDGINMWPTITQDAASPRNEFVYNIIAKKTELRGAIRVGDWKLIIGRGGTPSGWYLPEEANGTFIYAYFEGKVEDDTTNNDSIQLYNLKDDPEERNNLSQEHPCKVEELMEKFNKYKETIVIPINLMDDPSGDPANFNGLFSPGWCDPIIDPAEVNSSMKNYLQ